MFVVAFAAELGFLTKLIAGDNTLAVGEVQFSIAPVGRVHVLRVAGFYLSQFAVLGSDYSGLLFGAEELDSASFASLLYLFHTSLISLTHFLLVEFPRLRPIENNGP